MKHKRQYSPTEALVLLIMRSTTNPVTYDDLIERSGASVHTLPPIMRKLRREGLVIKTMEHSIANFTIAPGVQ